MSFQIKAFDPDETWTPCVVEYAHMLDSECDVFKQKTDLMDTHVLIWGPLELLRSACEKLILDLLKISVLTTKDNEFEGRIVLCNTAPNFANLVRKALMSRIEVFAVDKVEIFHNSSSIINEQFTHRVGMLAYACNSNNPMEDITYKGNLRICGPHVVRGRDIQFDDDFITVCEKFKDTVLLMLGKSQSIEADIFLKRGIALCSHDRYSAISTPRYIPHIHVKRKDKALKEAMTAMNLKFEKGLCGKTIITNADSKKAFRRERFEELLQSNPDALREIEIAKETCFEIIFESHGQLPPEKCWESCRESVIFEIKNILKRLQDLSSTSPQRK